MTPVWGEITLEEILDAIKGTKIAGVMETVPSALSTDSRSLRPGDLFWALKGETYDGHDYVDHALERGAVAVVLQKDYPAFASLKKVAAFIAVEDSLKALGDFAAWWRHKHKALVAAITGSAGKTTTKEMTAEILSCEKPTLKNHGNFNNLIGLPLTLLQLEAQHRRAVLEMGMNRVGEIFRLTEIADPDVGLITNVGPAHLEGLGDIKGVARAKAELVERISPSARMILNGDDDLLVKTASTFRKDVIKFGLGKNNDIRADSIEYFGRNGTAFELQHHGKPHHIILKVPGLQNVYNALAAASVALCMGEPLQHISERLSRFSGVDGRFQLSELRHDILLVNDTYNANPMSLKAALSALGSMMVENQRLIVGLGDMKELGPVTVEAHLEAGRMVADLGADYFMAIGQYANEMIRGALERGMTEGQTEKMTSHSEMALKAEKMLAPGDLIFLKASHKMELYKVAEALEMRMGI
jgi:UDP-N-acetylmuramoyl-tripeptide--D-alanyl-D-alanine ligase